MERKLFVFSLHDASPERNSMKKPMSRSPRSGKTSRGLIEIGIAGAVILAILLYIVLADTVWQKQSQSPPTPVAQSIRAQLNLPPVLPMEPSTILQSKKAPPPTTLPDEYIVQPISAVNMRTVPATLRDAQQHLKIVLSPAFHLRPFLFVSVIQINPDGSEGKRQEYSILSEEVSATHPMEWKRVTFLWGNNQFLIYTPKSSSWVEEK
jgi:hypothetical protein